MNYPFLLIYIYSSSVLKLQVSCVYNFPLISGFMAALAASRLPSAGCCAVSPPTRLGAIVQRESKRLVCLSEFVFEFSIKLIHITVAEQKNSTEWQARQR